MTGDINYFYSETNWIAPSSHVYQSLFTSMSEFGVMNLLGVLTSMYEKQTVFYF